MTQAECSPEKKIKLAVRAAIPNGRDPYAKTTPRGFQPGRPLLAPILNLTFHGVGVPSRALDAGEEDVWISRERFLGILDELERRRDFRLTFDDGNASDIEIALPALKERGMSATFFVVVGRIGTVGFIDSSDLKELLAAGMTIGCHGTRHRSWRGLTDEELDEELVVSRQLLETTISRDVDQTACPYGAYDRRVLHALRRAGYRRVFTSDGGLADPTSWLQPRNTVTTTGSGDAALLLATMARNGRGQRLKRLAKQWR